MVQLTDEDIKNIWDLLENLNDIFHDYEKFNNKEIINEFQIHYYPIIHKLYYETIWNILTDEQKLEFTGEEY